MPIGKISHFTENAKFLRPVRWPRIAAKLYVCAMKRSPLIEDIIAHRLPKLRPWTIGDVIELLRNCAAAARQETNRLMTSKFTPEIKAAALHLVAGAVEIRDEVPPGSHRLDRMQVTFTFPSMASVVRGEGTAGDGYDTGTIPAPRVHPTAAWLFLEKLKEKGGQIAPAEVLPVWKECIGLAERGCEAEPPAEAMEALAQIQAEAPPATPTPRKTQAKRTGVSEVKVTFKRLPGPKHGGKKAA